ncbi:GNAT family N-acetyltransferase [Paraglaciecola sp. 25GB23A]|uniref:GNAT family N-acetyltransferase n=1 Tax=Paraglaciecola sp. 25GB23A TaxID=3156068 RepID=UPI0032AFE31F
MNIREACQSDLKDIILCVNSAYEHYIERIGGKPAPMLANYEQCIKEKITYVLVDKSLGLVGLLVLILIESKKQLFIENITVHPKAQGNGYGKSLLQLAESIALSKGFKFIELYTHEKMVENISLYQHVGYSISNRIVEDGFSRVYMKKSLMNG